MLTPTLSPHRRRYSFLLSFSLSVSHEIFISLPDVCLDFHLSYQIVEDNMFLASTDLTYRSMF